MPVPPSLRIWWFDFDLKKKARQLGEMLPEPSDLPGDAWSTKRDRALRLGTPQSMTGRERRARDAKCVGVVRVYGKSGTGSLGVQLYTWATDDDADQFLPEMGPYRHLRPNWTISPAREVDGMSVLPMCRVALAVEHDISTPKGDVISRVAVGSFGTTSIFISASGREAALSWNEIPPIAQCIADRLSEGGQRVRPP